MPDKQLDARNLANNAGTDKPAEAQCNSNSTPSAAPASQSNPVEDKRGQGPNRRQSVVDRRAGMDRRLMSSEDAGYTGPERRSIEDRRDETGLERRRGPGRRRVDFRREAEEGEMNAEQFEFIMAVETYKRVNKKIYPTWTEVLEVVMQLGYRKVMPRQMNLENTPEAPISKVA
jgi:hypothetical protein